MGQGQKFDAAFHAALDAKGGEKFTANDVDDTLHRIAVDYAAHYSGNFGFMVDMQRAARKNGALTAGQTKGVLNCMRAAVNRSSGGPKPWEHPLGSDVAPFPGAYVWSGWTIKVEESKKYPGSFTVKYADRVTGSWNAFTWGGFVKDGVYSSAKGMDDRHVDMVRGALRVLFSDDEQRKVDGRSAFAHATGKCSHCRKAVSDEDSKDIGLGESVCQGKYERFLAADDGSDDDTSSEVDIPRAAPGVTAQDIEDGLAAAYATDADDDTCGNCGKSGDGTYCSDCVSAVKAQIDADEPTPTQEGDAPLTRAERRAKARAAHAATEARRLAMPDNAPRRR